MNDWKACFPRVYIIYITRRACPALAIKKFNRFSLCYYYIESMRFCQAFTESFTFPNMTDCTNTKRMVHSKRPGHSKCSRQPSRRFFRRRPYIPAPESWLSALILHCGKVDSNRLYCNSRRMKDIHIYNVYPAVQSLISSAQKQPNAQPNRNTTSHTIGSSLGAIWSTQPPANALRSAPNAHNTRTITGYLQPVQTPL